VTNYQLSDDLWKAFSPTGQLWTTCELHG